MRRLWDSGGRSQLVARAGACARGQFCKANVATSERRDAASCTRGSHVLAVLRCEHVVVADAAACDLRRVHRERETLYETRAYNTHVTQPQGDESERIELSMVKHCQQCGAETEAAYRKRPTRAQRERYDAVLCCIRCDAPVGYVFSAKEVALRAQRLAELDAAVTAARARVHNIQAALQLTRTNRGARWV
jgi:hypothetical protein